MTERLATAPGSTQGVSTTTYPATSADHAPVPKKTAKAAASRRQTRKHEPRDAHGVLVGLACAWGSAIREMSETTSGQERWLGGSIGVLTTAKLLLRVVSAGALQFTSDSAVLTKLERTSDEVADKQLDLLEVMTPAEVTPNVGLRRSTYAPLLAGRTDYHWSTDYFGAGERLPFDLDPLQPIAERVTSKLIDWLFGAGSLLRLRLDMDSKELWVVLVGVVALAKLTLTRHGNGRDAAVLEHLAEVASERKYQALWEAQPGPAP